MWLSVRLSLSLAAEVDGASRWPSLVLMRRRWSIMKLSLLFGKTLTTVTEIEILLEELETVASSGISNIAFFPQLIESNYHAFPIVLVLTFSFILSFLF